MSSALPFPIADGGDDKANNAAGHDHRKLARPHHLEPPIPPKGDHCATFKPRSIVGS